MFAKIRSLFRKMSPVELPTKVWEFTGRIYTFTEKCDGEHVVREISFHNYDFQPFPRKAGRVTVDLSQDAVSLIPTEYVRPSKKHPKGPKVRLELHIYGV